MPAVEHELLVVDEYSKSHRVFHTVSVPFVYHPAVGKEQNIIKLYVQWSKPLVDIKYSKPEAFNGMDIEYIDEVNLHEVTQSGKPYSKRYMAQREKTFPTRQQRIKRKPDGKLDRICLEENPFIDKEQREFIQSMFPVADYPFAYIKRIRFIGRRNADRKEVVVVEPRRHVGWERFIYGEPLREWKTNNIPRQEFKGIQTSII